MQIPLVNLSIHSQKAFQSFNNHLLGFIGRCIMNFSPRLTITTKLALSLLVFVLIFYGTIVYVFFHIQKMMNMSEEIVNINNVISTQSKILIENLLEMDGNAKKYSLLNKDVYREYFDASKEYFDTALETINHLSARGYSFPESFSRFNDEYSNHYEKLIQEGTDIRWVDEDTLNSWLALLVSLRDTNQEQIEHAMMEIHRLTFRSTRDGLLGFGLSVVIAFIGILFVSKSIIMPLRQLTHGLRTLSQGDYNNEINIKSQDEFADLANAFNDMNRELQEEENLRADFIATLSHEIRTPLSSIQESVNLMAEEVLGEVNEKQHKFLSIASSELTRINEMLNQLMDVSKLEAGPQPYPREPLETTQLVENCIHSLDAMARLKSISLISHIRPDLPKVRGVREEIQQVLTNIVGNAIKFSANGTEIIIRVQKSEIPGYVLFTIRDHGPGIDENDISLIFHKYYRSKSVRKHMDGVGLGLYISKKIIQDLGGTISVSNNTDLGATFAFTLPESNHQLIQ